MAGVILQYPVSDIAWSDLTLFGFVASQFAEFVHLHREQWNEHYS